PARRRLAVERHADRGVHRSAARAERPVQDPRRAEDQRHRRRRRRADACGAVSVSLRLYDTSKRDTVAFEPGPLVTMYTCGITPYDSTHLGHASTYVFYDVLQRRLIDIGHTVRCVRNITDVDDPLLDKAKELGVHYLDLAAAETARFNGDMKAL